MNSDVIGTKNIPLFETIFKLPEKTKIKILLDADDQLLSDYFEDHFFVKDFGLENLSFQRCVSKMSQKKTMILKKLIKLKHQSVLQEIQKEPALRYVLSRGLQKATQELKTYLKTFNYGHVSTLQTLLTVEELNKHVPKKNLLKILKFVSKKLFLNETEGVLSRSRPHIKKFHAVQYNIPSDLHYDRISGDLYINLRLLGKGSYKIVKKRLLLSSPELPFQAVAKQKHSFRAEHECTMLLLCKGLPHVISHMQVNTYFSLKKNEYIQSIIYPFYNMGDLSGHLNTKKISPKEKLQIIAEIIMGVLGLHKRGIIHRDLKPANIFLYKTYEKTKEVFHAVIGDLGLSCLMNYDPLRHENAGSPFYKSPNLLKGMKTADFTSDAWSVGISVAELLYGLTAWNDLESESELIDFYDAFEDVFTNPPPEDESSIDFVIWKLLRPNDDERMNLEDALETVQNLILKM